MTDYYSSIDQVKYRCLIGTADVTKDTQLSICVLEASRHIDEWLRPYMSYAQTLTLKSSGYTNCTITDIGKQVLDDESKVGKLLDYNNTTRLWRIKTTSTIAVDSTLKLDDGKGTGVAYNASSCDVTEQESPYFVFNSIPLGTIPDQLSYICADYATALFFRRYIPEKYSDVWFEDADKKMEEFINNNWKKGVVQFK